MVVRRTVFGRKSVRRAARGILIQLRPSRFSLQNEDDAVEIRRGFIETNSIHVKGLGIYALPGPAATLLSTPPNMAMAEWLASALMIPQWADRRGVEKAQAGATVSTSSALNKGR